MKTKTVEQPVTLVAALRRVRSLRVIARSFARALDSLRCELLANAVGVWVAL
jgi:hypothetical protein